MLYCCAHQVDMLYDVLTSHCKLIAYAYDMVEHGPPWTLGAGNTSHPFSSSTPVSLWFIVSLPPTERTALFLRARVG